MPYVYSTATCPIAYVEHMPDLDKSMGFAKEAKRVTIAGGHGVATKQLITPKGIMTKVSDEDLAFLLNNDAFQRHVKKGFMTYDKTKVDPEKRAANMAKGDRSAPLTPDDFKESEYSNADARIYMGTPSKQ